MNARRLIGLIGIVSMCASFYIGLIMVIEGARISSIIGLIWFIWSLWALMHFITMLGNRKTYIPLTGAFTCMALILLATIIGVYDPTHGLPPQTIVIATIAVTIWNLILILDPFMMNSWGKEKEIEEEIEEEKEKERAESEAPAPTKEN